MNANVEALSESLASETDHLGALIKANDLSPPRQHVLGVQA